MDPTANWFGHLLMDLRKFIWVDLIWTKWLNKVDIPMDDGINVTQMINIIIVMLMHNNCCNDIVIEQDSISFCSSFYRYVIWFVCRVILEAGRQKYRIMMPCVESWEQWRAAGELIHLSDHFTFDQLLHATVSFKWCSTHCVMKFTRIRVNNWILNTNQIYIQPSSPFESSSKSNDKSSSCKRRLLHNVNWFLLQYRQIFFIKLPIAFLAHSRFCVFLDLRPIDFNVSIILQYLL